MSKDVHDIDGLFKDGIEGHREEPPPFVWEAVSHDLDKKQASLYKDKYYRLKRAALLLLLFAFLGTAYIIYHVISNKETGNTQNKVSPAPDAVLLQKQNTLNKKRTEKKGEGGEPVVKQQQNINKTLEAPVVLLPAPATINNKEEKIRDANLKTAPPVTRRTTPKWPASTVTAVNVKQPLTNPSIAAGPYKQTGRNDFQTSGPSRPILPLAASDHLLSPVDLKPIPGSKRNNVSQQKMASLAKGKIRTPHPFSLSAFVSPNFSFDHLEDDDHLSGPGRNRQEVHRDEQPDVSFSGGLLLSYDLTNKLSLQSGVAVTRSTTSISPKTIYAKADNNGHARYELHCSSGYSYISPKSGAQPAVGDSVATLGSTSTLSYISLPASVSLRVQKGKFALYPGIGIDVNFLTSGTTKTGLPNTAGNEDAVSNITGLKPAYLDGRIGIGVEYDISRKISIGVKPAARLAITPVNKETPVKSYQNYLSLETGVRIKL